LEDLGVDGRMILKWSFKKWDEEWNAVAQDRDSWRTLVKSVMNIRHKMRRSSWLPGCW